MRACNVHLPCTGSTKRQDNWAAQEGGGVIWKAAGERRLGERKSHSIGCASDTEKRSGCGVDVTGNIQNHESMRQPAHPVVYTHRRNNNSNEVHHLSTSLSIRGDVSEQVLKGAPVFNGSTLVCGEMSLSLVEMWGGGQEV